MIHALPDRVCGRPPSCKSFFESACQGECGRMSGLLTRPGTTAAKMGSAARVPNEPETLNAARSDGLSRAWDRLITPSPCCSSRLRPQREVVTLKFLGGGHGGGAMGRDVVVTRGARRGASLSRSAERLAGLGLGPIVALAADHQLPGDAHRLVGQGDGGKLLGLALQKSGQPGRGPGTAAFDLLDVGGGARYQGGAQGLVAGTGDAAVSHLAGGRMILRSEADPGGTLAAGSEGGRIADL